MSYEPLKLATTDDFAQLLDLSIAATIAARNDLRSIRLGEMFNADNVAVLFNEKEMMDEWVRYVVSLHGLQHYRPEEHDTIYETTVRGTADTYHVNFEFLRFPGGTLRTDGKPFRVEAMHINGGFSEIHDPIISSWKGASVAGPVQVSFKCLNIAQMAGVHDALKTHTQWKEDAHFLGSYGYYTYFRHPDRAFYLKTRINLRD